MTRLIKKYTILIVASILIVRLLTAVIMTIWPDLLTTKVSDIETHKLGTAYLESGIEYMVNVFFIILIYIEMKSLKIYSFPILILTFFSNLLGIIFFFFIIAYNSININSIEND
ncbi:MAG: hypothetical protein WCK02_12220 [Bacteroidota bacterium]